MTFFYDLNKKLDSIREKPETTHGQLNERDMSRAAKGYEKYGKQGMEALAKAGREGKALDPVRNKYDKYDNKEVDEGMGDMARKVGSMAKKVGGAVLDKVGHGNDADMMRDLQRKMGVPQTGMKPGAEPNPKQVKEKMNPAKAKSFAALAEPKDKITFADKIAGAKKEVDEMLGDVAAEAMKSALSGGQKKLDKNDNGKLDANDFAMLRKGAKQKTTEEDDDNPFTNYKKPRAGGVDKPKVGSIERGHKHDIEHTATGRKVTRRVDPAGISVGADDDMPADGEKRGRGRPKKAGGPAQERVTAKSRKVDRTRFQSKKTNEGGGMKQTFAILDDTLIDQIAAMNGAEVDPDAGSVETYDENTARQLIAFAKKNPQRLKQTQSMNTAGMRPMAQAVGGTATGPEYGLKEEGGDLKAAMTLLKKAGYKVSKAADGAEQVDEKATSKKQQKFMGMVHATQKGEKAPSKEVAKVAKTMKKSDAEDFASTKHKGLPEKKKPEAKKKEKTEEAGGTGTPTASSGFGFGKGIYDSINRDLEAMIAESMSVNMSDSTEGGKSLTITASDEDALKLGMLLKNAGLGGGGEEGSYMGGKTFCPTCGSGDCGCGDIEKEIDENAPDWPTDEEGTEDAMMYSGGLNGPKSTGQSTVPVLASQEERQHTYEADLQRMRDIAGIKEAKKPDFLDDGDKKEPFKKAVDDKKEKKVEESIFALTNSWKAYKG